MNKKEIIDRLENLNFDKAEYWLLAGGAMVLYGLREATPDIDLGCTKKFADELEKQGYPVTIMNDGTRRISFEEDIEIFEDWIFDEVVMLDNISVISLKGLIEMKKSLGREKDLRDIKLIEDFLRSYDENAAIIVDDKGNELLDIIQGNEEIADKVHKPITHCLAVVKLGDDYLMGWNKWRQDWEIFGGCREENETLKECINRECQEELGLVDVDFQYIGLMHYKMAPGYFNPEWHFEYGGLYGITLPAKYLEIIEKYRTDKEEVEKLAFYREIKGKEKIAPIDEKLLEYWK